MAFIKFRHCFYVKKCSTSGSFLFQHGINLTKLVRKLKQVDFGKGFRTAFNKNKTLFTFIRLDYNHAGVVFDRKFDAIDELILNSIYSFGMGLDTDEEGYYAKAERPIFGARKILQHVFGNVEDHFQKEIVRVIERHIEDMSYMKLTFDLRDNLGNSAYLMIGGEQYRPVAVKETLLDASIIEFESRSFNRKFQVYRLNRKSPLFTFAEKLSQVTSWSVRYMAVPCRKTLQNAVIISYLLTKIFLIRNKNNHYLNTGILVETIFEDLNLEVTTRKKKKAILDSIRIMFDYWVEVGLLVSYEFVKMGQAFHKIEFKVNLMGAEKC